MGDKFTAITSEIYDYLLNSRSADPPGLDALIQETAELGDISIMQVAPEQGAFMAMLVRLIGAKQAVEVGTFTGYSAACIAAGLGAEGHLLCCDVSEEWTSVARKHWQAMGLDDRIDLRIAPAAETLRALPAEEYIDFAFVDADKTGYQTYFEEILARMRPNGLLLFDNVLWGGSVADSSANDDNTVALRTLNRKLAVDERVDVVMLPVADGLTLVRKR